MTKRRLAAILSGDVAGYSRLMADDEAETIRTLKSYRGLFSGLIRQHAGHVVDDPGDEVLGEFPSVVDAVTCAVAIQRGLARRNAELPERRRMLYRIGVNLGDVVVEDARIYGDGVNIAARMQALAEPGGVAISGTAFDQVEGRLGLEFEDKGEHRVKNIPRPVRVYTLRASDVHERQLATTVPGFGGVPAIAVLAFDNLSGDPEQEYFADGIAEDLITRLSAGRLPVIARNSSFVYKGQAVDVKRVGRELGARYVVEGSVRRAADRVRVSAQLIDATSGAHVWAERYDRELQDVFALQDEITEAIAGAMGTGLLQSEQARARRLAPRDLGAWELCQRGWWHWSQVTEEDIAKARGFFELALDRDPDFAFACSGLAMVHLSSLIFEETKLPGAAIQKGVELAHRSAELDPADVFSQFALSMAYALTGQREQMIAAAELALELNPSLAMAHGFLGRIRAATDDPEQAIQDLEKAMRLSPRDPFLFSYLQGVGNAHFAAGRYAEAVDWCRRSLQRKPDYLVAHVMLAAALAQLEQLDEARAQLQKAAELGFRKSPISGLLSTLESDFGARVMDGLRKAGLKE